MAIVDLFSSSVFVFFHMILGRYFSNQIKSNLSMQKGQLATNNANIKTV